MPLEPYQRGSVWWAKGRIEYNGAPISEYYRCSTGASSQKGAQDWCAAEEQRQIRRFLVGEERALTFAEAVLLYPANEQTAGFLIPIVERIGDDPVVQITPKAIRALGPEIYPDACTDTWHRNIITPTRAVINNAHDEGKCAPIRIKGYSEEERIAQDKRRGRASRVEKTPGSWEWLLRFRQHASPRHGALALTMFMTGARISQALAMHPGKHLDLQNGRICIPGAKGHGDRWLDIPPELVADLANLPKLWPRGWKRTLPNLRVFGFADRSSPRKGWDAACDRAGIERLSFHAAGRHGFGQEMNIRNPVDEKAAGQFGGWRDTKLMRATYTHAEGTAEKIHQSMRAGLRQAEQETGLKLASGT